MNKKLKHCKENRHPQAVMKELEIIYRIKKYYRDKYFEYKRIKKLERFRFLKQREVEV